MATTTTTTTTTSTTAEDSLSNSDLDDPLSGSGSETTASPPPRMTSNWDPMTKTNEVMLPWCLGRVKKDIASLYTDPLPGILAVVEDGDVSLVHALITGPTKTPYEGGFFYFILRFPPDYPISPPKVKLMTTANNSVRFNPNLYADGKVCLSILGTWSGPSWSPASTLSSVLLSVQSLMGEWPYHNEPGYETRGHSTQAKEYNEIIVHETIRVAVCDMLEGCNRDTAKCPQKLKDSMEELFLINYPHYVKVVKDRLHMNNKTMKDPFGGFRSTVKLSYTKLLSRLTALHAKITAKVAANEDSVLQEDEEEEME